MKLLYHLKFEAEVVVWQLLRQTFPNNDGEAALLVTMHYTHTQIQECRARKSEREVETVACKRQP
jgi:hypothetical protein